MHNLLICNGLEFRSVTFNCIFMTKATIVPKLLKKIYSANYNIKRFSLFSNTKVGKISALKFNPLSLHCSVFA